MNSGLESKTSGTTYSWPGVLAFLNEQCLQIETERTQWEIERKQLTEQVGKLEEHLKASDALVSDLTRRIKMLEFALRQERIKYAKLTGGHHRVNSEVLSNVLVKAEEDSSSALARRRTRVHRQMLSKYLQELGLEDIFTGESAARVHHRPSKSIGFVLPAGAPEALPARTGTEDIPGKSMEVLASLKGHFDSVRGLYFSSQDGILASAGEDALLKLWDVNGFEEISENAEPYLTLRGHSAPVTCMTGAMVGDEELLFTADLSGSICVWELRRPSEVDTYSATPERGYCAAHWPFHSDVVWGLRHHPTEALLLSVASDGSAKLWRTTSAATAHENWSAGRSSVHIVKTISDNEPGCCTWLNASQFAIGGNCAVRVFDSEQGLISTITAEATPFCIDAVPNSSLVATGFDDRHLRIYDAANGKLVKDFVSHTDCVSAVLVDRDANHVITGGCDGSVRCWDLRNYQCLHEVPAHRKKYDEGVTTLAQHANYPLLVSGGADSLIKLYSFRNTENS